MSDRSKYKRAKRAPVATIKSYLNDLGVAYYLTYFIDYRAGIRVTYSQSKACLVISADYTYSQEDIECFVLSKSNVIRKWLDAVNLKKELPLPPNCKTSSFERRLIDRCLRLLEEHNYCGPKPDAYKVSHSKSYWGRCTSSKTIYISCYCYYLNDDQLFYLLMHEHAHLIHMHHKSSFWSLVEMYCPDYLIRRKELKKYILKK